MSSGVWSSGVMRSSSGSRFTASTSRSLGRRWAGVARTDGLEDPDEVGAGVVHVVALVALLQSVERPGDLGSGQAVTHRLAVQGRRGRVVGAAAVGEVGNDRLDRLDGCDGVQ